MEIDEALQILSIDDVEDAQDAFDDVLFEHKSFFLSKVPFTKLFSSKLKKLGRLNEAKNTLVQEEFLNKNFTNSIVKIKDSLNVKEVVNLFHQNHNEIKRSVNNSQSFEEISFYIDELLKNYTAYAKRWFVFQESELRSDVKMSVEPDSMSILASVDSFNAIGLSFFKEIIQLEDDNLLKTRSYSIIFVVKI